MQPKHFQSTISPAATDTRPPFGVSQPHFFHHFIRDFFTIPTWLALGALLQTALFLSPIRKVYAVTPVTGFLAWCIVDTTLASFGVIKNPMMDCVIRTRYTAVCPDAEGKFSRGIGARKGDSPGGDPVVVFLLGFRCNHPLGALAPGYKSILDYMQSMFDDLQAQSATNGFMGQNFYLNAGSRRTNSEIMTVYYFRSVEDLHAFAHAPLHKKAWEWYSKVTRQYPWLGIMHELYYSPAGGWENVYANWEPSGFATTSHKYTDENGREKWMSPIVEAKGRLSTSAGRIGTSMGDNEET